MMINLNPQARLPALAPAPVASTAATQAEDDDRSDSLFGTRASAGNDLGNLLLAKRLLRLKKQIEQLQQKLRRANARLAMVKAARAGSDAGRAMLVGAARAQVLALTSALSMAQTALFQAESAMIGSVDTSA